MKERTDTHNGLLTSGLQRWLVRLGYILLLPSLIYLLLAMAGVLPAGIFAVGATSGFKIIGSCAVIGCLIVAAGYWDF